uniref:Uncharacterized protein n=1 Tax=Rhizophora mucronata TaxID=61149 RepID=A0A2P2K4J4_RHIMU
MLLVGYGIWKDEATVKSMSRFGDRRLEPWTTICSNSCVKNRLSS